MPPPCRLRHQRPLGPNLVALLGVCFLVSLANLARASELYLEVVQPGGTAGTSWMGSCELCHLDEDPIEVAGTPFAYCLTSAAQAVDLDLSSGNPEHLLEALNELGAQGSDCDRDGVSDFVELGLGSDPNGTEGDSAESLDDATTNEDSSDSSTNLPMTGSSSGDETSQPPPTVSCTVTERAGASASTLWLALLVLVTRRLRRNVSHQCP